MRPDKSRGFSLIELLVVIAIVGVLAKVGYSSYKDYIVAVRLSTVGNNVKALMNNALAFYGSKGYFPNTIELGLGGNGVDADSTLAARAIGPYMLPGTTSDVGLHVSRDATQKKSGIIATRVNTATIGLPTSRFDAQVSCNYWIDSNGIAMSYCAFWAANASSGSDPGRTVPGLANLNTTTGWDFNNYYANIPVFAQ